MRSSVSTARVLAAIRPPQEVVERLHRIGRCRRAGRGRVTPSVVAASAAEFDAYCSQHPDLPQDTARPVVVERDVSELAGQRIGAVKQLSVEKQSDADSFGDGDGHQVLDVVRVTAEPQLRQRARARRILEDHGQVDVDSSRRRRFTWPHPRFGANRSVPDWSTRPGRLTPTPS